MDGRERSVLIVAALGHALCHISTLILPQVIGEASAELRIANIGWVVALGPFFMGFVAVPAGLLGDRFGPRRIYSLYLGLLILAAGAAAFAASSWLFVVAAALVGVAAAFHHPVGLAWIAEALPSRRAQAIGIHGFVGHFGSTLAPLLVLRLQQGGSWRSTYFVVAALATTLLVAQSLRGRTEDELRGSASRALPSRVRLPWRLALAPAMVVLLLAMVPAGLVHQGFWSTWTSFVKVEAEGASLRPIVQALVRLVPDRSVWGAQGDALPIAAIAGALATAVLAFGSLGELFGARLARRSPTGGGLLLYAAMNAISAAGLVGAAWLRGPWLLVSAALFCFFHFGTQPVENELIARRVDPRVRGIAYGLKFVVSFGVGSFAAQPAIRGWSHHGFPPVLLAIAGLAAGGALSCVLLARRPVAPVAS